MFKNHVPSLLGVVLYGIDMKKSIFMCRRLDFIEFLGELPLSY